MFGRTSSAESLTHNHPSACRCVRAAPCVANEGRGRGCCRPAPPRPGAAIPSPMGGRGNNNVTVALNCLTHPKNYARPQTTHSLWAGASAPHHPTCLSRGEGHMLGLGNTCSNGRLHRAGQKWRCSFSWCVSLLTPRRAPPIDRISPASTPTPIKQAE